jgi:hypothetical protein
VGAGRSEIAQAIFGLDPQVTGRVFVHGREVAIRSPRQAMDLGSGFLPEDRKTQGLVLSMGGRANLTLPILNRLSRMGFVRTGRTALTKRYFIVCWFGHRTLTRSVVDVGRQPTEDRDAKWLASESRMLLIEERPRVMLGRRRRSTRWINDCPGSAAMAVISSE